MMRGERAGGRPKPMPTGRTGSTSRECNPWLTFAADSYGHVWVRRPGHAERCSRCKTPGELGHGVVLKCEPGPVKSAERSRGVEQPHTAGLSR